MRKALAIASMLLVSTVIAIAASQSAPSHAMSPAGSESATSPALSLSARSPLTVTQYTSYLPLVERGRGVFLPCTPEDAFGLQIAALHEVESAAGGPPARMTEAEYVAFLDEGFPSLVDALDDSGACWVRVRVDWAWIQPEEPPSDYVWGPYHDVKLRLVAETGVQLVGVVEDVPAWAGPYDHGPIDIDRMDDFAQFLTDVVNRYKLPPYNIHVWELFNEPDWTMAGGAAGWGLQGYRYVKMLQVAYPAIKAADPTATVLMGGMAWDHFLEYGGVFYRYFPDTVMQYGGAPYFDAMNIHYFPDHALEWERWVPEGNPPTCGIVDDGQGLPYEAWGIDVIAKTEHLRHRMEVCFDVSKPIWITELAEHGYPEPADLWLPQQARYVVQGMVRALAAGVDKVVWYALVSPPYDPYEQGLLWQDTWDPKPAYTTYQVVTGALAGFHYLYTLDVTGVEGYVFGNASGQQRTVAWANGAGLQPSYLTFATRSLRVVDRWGTETLVEDGGPGDTDGVPNGSITLELPAPPEDLDPELPRLSAEPLIIIE